MFIPVPLHPGSIAAEPATTTGIEGEKISIGMYDFFTEELSTLLNKMSY